SCTRMDVAMIVLLLTIACMRIWRAGRETARGIWTACKEHVVFTIIPVTAESEFYEVLIKTGR
ncbi:MAG: hypothetical protein ACXU8O_06205, partial [Asticcacaulis sp.]